MNESLKLGPSSRDSVESLGSDVEGILTDALARMGEAGHGHHLRAARSETREMLAEIGRWIGEGGQDDDRKLRESCRALAFRLRGGSVPIAEALEEIAQLENALFGDGHGAAGARLRRAFRILWTEVFQVNYLLDRRRDRDRTDALERFGSIISHELGNRLGAAQTGILVLRDRDDLEAGRRHELLELIADGIEAALETVDDVTALTEVQGFRDEERQPFRSVAVQVARGLRPFARSRSVRIEIEPSELPTVDVDGGRLRLVISNLMVNAVRYSDEREDDRFVRLEATTSEHELSFTVADNGMGIPEDARSRIFDFRVRGHDDDSEGSGMGLTIALEAAKQLGGDIGLDSEEGEGTVFRVTIPLRDPAESSD